MRYPSLKAAKRRFMKNARQLTCAEQSALWRAYNMAEAAHRGQKKFGIESYPYFVHPLAVFNFLFETFRVRDYHLLAAALLHDVVEDGGVALETIEHLFGPETHDIVKGVTRMPEAHETEAEKKILKARFFNDFVRNGSRGIKLLGIADKYDTIRRAPLIPRSNPNRAKFPRWIKEAEAFLELAKKTDVNAYCALAMVLRKLKRCTAKRKEA